MKTKAILIYKLDGEVNFVGTYVFLLTNSSILSLKMYALNATDPEVTVQR